MSSGEALFHVSNKRSADLEFPIVEVKDPTFGANSFSLMVTLAFILIGGVVYNRSRTFVSMSCENEHCPQSVFSITSRRTFSRLLCGTSFTVIADACSTEHSVHSGSEQKTEKYCALQMADKLRFGCQPFLNAIRPFSHSSLLWRGHPNHVQALVQSNPSADLLDPGTYDKNGASFFRALNMILTLQSMTNSGVPLPSESHIGTGSFSTAGQWGIPLTVWPCGNFRYAFWKNGDLIYELGDTLTASYYQRGPMLFGEHLREALQSGKEVMFQCHSFFILPSENLIEVLEILQSS